MKILTLNAGSNSLKFEVVSLEPGAETDFGQSLLSGSIDDIGKDSAVFARLENKKPVEKTKVEARDHGQATELLLDWLEKGNGKEHGVRDIGDIDRIAHRVVHGGDTFDAPVEVTDAVIRGIEDLEDLAPLHNRSALAVLRATRTRTRTRSGSKEGIPTFAIFDTVFHRNMPEEAARYALPVDVADRHKIRRYGFHGISHKYMMLRYATLTGARLEDTNLVTLHLEGGSSAAAIRGGRSIDTSMGFTPLEGLMMGTRSGDLDPALVTYLMKKEKLGAAEVETFLNKKCGLLGVSGISPDSRELVEQRANPRARLALEMFSYRVRKYVGAYLAALGGATAIVVGGGIGENTPLVRELVFEPFGWAGAHLDRSKNETTLDGEGTITTAASRLPVWVIPTQENRMMARETANL